MTTDRVCVVWLEGNDIFTLTYWNGKIRTYEVNNVDGRVAPGPLVDRPEELWQLLESGARCRLPVGMAREAFGWAKSKFA